MHIILYSVVAPAGQIRGGKREPKNFGGGDKTLGDDIFLVEHTRFHGFSDCLINDPSDIIITL